MFESSLHEECEDENEISKGSNYPRQEEYGGENVGVG